MTITLDDLIAGDRKEAWTVEGIQRCFLPLVEHLPHTSTTLQKGGLVYRGRPHTAAEPFKSAREIFDMERRGSRMGRANLKDRLVFYGCAHSDMVPQPLRTVCMEMSKRMRGDRAGHITLTIGVREVLTPIETFVFHSPDTKVNSPKQADAIAELDRLREEIPASLRHDVVRLQRLLDSEYSKRVGYDEPDRAYLISAAFSDMVFHQYAALAYPSVENVAGQNLALLPQAVEHLRPIGAILVQFQRESDERYWLSQYSHAQGAGPWEEWSVLGEDWTHGRPFINADQVA